MRTVLLVLLVLACHLVYGEEPPAEVKKFLDASAKYKDANPNAKGKYPIPLLNDGAFVVGQLGMIDDATAIRIDQVVDGSTVLATVILTKQKVVGGAGFKLDVRFEETDGASFFLEGFPTGAFVDGQKLAPGVVEVMGTRAYTTVAGAKRTVQVLRWFNMKTTKAHLAAIDPPAPENGLGGKPAAKPLEPAPARLWSDRSGKFKVTASYAGFKPGKVVLEKEDGSTIEVDLATLANEDRQYAVRTARERGDLK